MKKEQSGATVLDLVKKELNFIMETAEINGYKKSTLTFKNYGKNNQ
jgi:hypothetical protein